jgi:alpha/beta superfamily hydrolase
MHPVLPGPVKTAHIVLAYPLSPRPALTLFHGGTYAAGLTALLADARADVLVVYGTADEFTAADKYTSWADGLRVGAAAKLELACVEDATHFWRGEARRRLHEVVCTWLDRPADA